MKDNPEKAREKARESMRRWRKANLEKAREQSRESSRRWRENNQEKSREIKRRYREANLEKERERTRRWNNANPGKRREHNLKKFGITHEQYEQMLSDQNGVCAICGTENPGRMRKNFQVDHCHKTGVIRGLLCNHCNTGLGHYKDDPALLDAAAKYLRGWKINGQVVPK